MSLVEEYSFTINCGGRQTYYLDWTHKEIYFSLTGNKYPLTRVPLDTTDTNTQTYWAPTELKETVQRQREVIFLIDNFSDEDD